MILILFRSPAVKTKFSLSFKIGQRYIFEYLQKISQWKLKKSRKSFSRLIQKIISNDFIIFRVKKIDLRVKHGSGIRFQRELF